MQGTPYSDGVTGICDYLRLRFGIRVKGPQYTLLLDLPGQPVGAPANLPSTKRAAAPNRCEDTGNRTKAPKREHPESPNPAIGTQIDQGLGVDCVISDAVPAFSALTICLFAQVNHLMPFEPVPNGPGTHSQDPGVVDPQTMSFDTTPAFLVYLKAGHSKVKDND